MPHHIRTVLISGASVAGPVLAYWLRRFGYQPTVVEHAASPRETGGHAVDLFGAAMDVMQRMGLKEAVTQCRTANERISVAARRGKEVEAEVSRLAALISDRHVEIMRDDLMRLLLEHTASDVEYIYGESIAGVTEVSDGVEVTFEYGPDRKFDLVVGADGLHSNVRKLVFGAEESFSRFLGAYLAVCDLPDGIGTPGYMRTYLEPSRLVVFYVTTDGGGRAIFMLRSDEPLDYHYRDIGRQKQLINEAFGDMGWRAPELLREMDAASQFYFDSITQIHMDSWSRGRVALVGDAGYSPGPAVGGGTSLAVLGAYTLAGELYAAGGDHRSGFAAYENVMAAPVAAARGFAHRNVKQLIPDSAWGVWAVRQATRLTRIVPGWLVRRLASNSNTSPLRETGPLRQY